MVVNEVVFETLLWLVLGFCLRSTREIELLQDQTTSRPNTLLDDADDIQKQLDNEVRDKISFGTPKIWILNFPTSLPIIFLTNYENDLDKRSVSNSPLQRYGRQAEIDNNDMDIDEDLMNVSMKLDSNETSSSKPTSTYKPTFDDDAPSLSDVMKTNWNYNEQYKWPEKYPECAGRSQSPVNVPVQGLIFAMEGRRLKFINYDVSPQKWILKNDDQKVIMYGSWAKNKRPYIVGGAAHNRLYLFYCLLVHWPSEHHIGNLMYPLETQALYVSSDYQSFDEALKTTDPQAFLGISSIYKYSENTHTGIATIFKSLLANNPEGSAIPLKPLSFFNPPFRKYACYQGSLSFPPCKESVLWLIRGRALPVTREVIECLHRYNMYGSELQPIKFYIRGLLPLNDRRVLLFG